MKYVFTVLLGILFCHVCFAKSQTYDEIPAHWILPAYVYIPSAFMDHVDLVDVTYCYKDTGNRVCVKTFDQCVILSRTYQCVIFGRVSF